MASVPISMFQAAAPEQFLSGHPKGPRRKGKNSVIRRSPTPVQGRALEILGHAIEYLVDSDLADSKCENCAAASEAASVLMRLNREVFAECEEIVPFWHRVGQRLHRVFERKHHHVHVVPVSGPRT